MLSDTNIRKMWDSAGTTGNVWKFRENHGQSRIVGKLRLTQFCQQACPNSAIFGRRWHRGESTQLGFEKRSKSLQGSFNVPKILLSRLLCRCGGAGLSKFFARSKKRFPHEGGNLQIGRDCETFQTD